MKIEQLEHLLETMEPVEIRNNFREELASNPECLHLLETFEQIPEDLKSLHSQDPPLVHFPKVAQPVVLVPRPKTESKPFQWRPWVSSLAALLVLGFGYWAFNIEKPEGSADSAPEEEHQPLSIPVQPAVEDKAETPTPSEELLEREVSEKPKNTTPKKKAMAKAEPLKKAIDEASSGEVAPLDSAGPPPGSQIGESRAVTSPQSPESEHEPLEEALAQQEADMDSNAFKASESAVLEKKKMDSLSSYANDTQSRQPQRGQSDLEMLTQFLEDWKYQTDMGVFNCTIDSNFPGISCFEEVSVSSTLHDLVRGGKNGDLLVDGGLSYKLNHRFTGYQAVII